MPKTGLIKGADVVLMSDKTIHGMVSRYSEYGLLSTLTLNKATKLGVVCNYNGASVVVTFGSKIAVVPFSECDKDIQEVYRSSSYTNEFASLDLQDSCMAMFANPNSYKLLKKQTECNIGGVILYILTSSMVRYPINYAEFKFKLADILSESNGYYRIL